MLLLKLLAPIVIVLLIIFQILVERGWKNKLIVQYKGLISHLPKIVLGLTVLTIVMISNGHLSSKKMKSAMKELKNQLTFVKKNAEINLQLAVDNDSISEVRMTNLRQTVLSFSKIASTNYPELDSTAALHLLAAELKEGNSVAARDIFKPFSKSRKLVIKQELEKVQKAYKSSPKIKFHVDTKISKNDTIIRNLQDLLNEAGFLTDFELGTFPRSDIARSWEIHTYSIHAKLIQEILYHIKPYVNPNYALARRDTKDWDKILGEFPKNEVHFYIYTSPNYNNDGQITY